MFEAVLSPQAPAPIGPYSQAVRAGDWLFLSGQIPLDPGTGEIVGTSAAEQAERVLANLRAVLAEAGLDLGHVVRTTIYLVDLAEFAAVNEVYARHFSNSPAPARSTIQVSALPRGSRIEIDAIAAFPA
ncbi:MAG: RidA family protein [Fibrobacteria bacterium]|nr:RidA family protein [Fibrobacteria bacterium]